MQAVDIYIDTSVRGPKRRHGSYIYKIATTQNGRMYDVGGMETLEDTTESSLTVHALEAALGRLVRPCRLTIWTNCPYAASVLNNRWFDGWAQNGWKKAGGKPVCDAACWQNIRDLLAVHEYEVRLKEHHQFSDWMGWMLREEKTNDRCGRNQKIQGQTDEI